MKLGGAEEQAPPLLLTHSLTHKPTHPPARACACIICSAYELYDQDISFLSNRAAARYEAGDMEGAIADCDAAVERGRELRADYKVSGRGGVCGGGRALGGAHRRGGMR